MEQTKYLINSSELLNQNDIPITIRDKILLAPGGWNESKYDAKGIEYAYLNTDWKNKSNFSLYLDHKDTTGQGAGSWVGYVKNIRLAEGRKLIGDLEIWNPLTALFLTKAKAKFGVSATLKGFEDEKTKKMENYRFESFSIVTDPACKESFINLAQKLNKNERRLKIVTMAEEEIQEDKPEQQEETEEVKELAKKKKEYPEPEEEEKKQQAKKKKEPEEELKKKLPEEEEKKQARKKKVPDEEELSESDVLGMLSEMTVEELSAWTDFVKKMKKKYPKMSFSAIAKAYKQKKQSDDTLENLSDTELMEEIAQRNEILRRRALYSQEETPEEKVDKLTEKVKELQEKLREPERKTLSAAPGSIAEEGSMEGFANYLVAGGQGSFSLGGTK